MRTRTIPPVLATVLLLCGCGGGSPPPAAGAVRAAAAGPSRMQTLASAAAGVAPTAAAQQLMDFGESRFPQYFPSPAATQSSGPFVYRHYPQTGIYLGVVVQETPGYTLLGVYVMGGPFGPEPQLVGPLSSFITPVDTDGPGPTGASNGCFDQWLALDEVPGARVIEVHRTAGSPTGQAFTSEFEVIGPAVFEGQAATQQQVRHAMASYPGGIPAGADLGQAQFRYYRKTGPAEITHFGDSGLVTSTSTAGGFTSSMRMESRSVYEPPRVDRLYSLPLGGSDSTTTTYRTRATVTTTFTGQPPRTTETDTSTARTETVRFLRREVVTVPLGSFNACVFEWTASDQPGASLTSWIADGQGVSLRTVQASPDGVTTTEAIAASINGQAVTP